MIDRKPHTDRGSFWDASWRRLDPQRVRDYAGRPDGGPDPIIDFLRARGAVRVCDAGCGCGVYTRKLIGSGFDVTGFDLSAEAVRLAGSLLSEAGCRAKLLTASVLRTPFPDAAFDAVVARDVLDHLPLREARQAICELRRITRPGGCVLLTLDALDADYAAQPHAVSTDGDLLFSGGKWDGMVFHPFTPEEILSLAPKGSVRILSDDGGYTVAIET